MGTVCGRNRSPQKLFASSYLSRILTRWFGLLYLGGDDIMTAPTPKRKFEQLIKEHGCLLVKGNKEWKVLRADGTFVCSIAVRHGKQEIKAVYVKRFLQVMGAADRQQAPTLPDEAGAHSDEEGSDSEDDSHILE
jgi:hypothetical protein